MTLHASIGRDLASAHRSLQRYLSTILPEPWDVQPLRREPQTRPLCVVQPLPTTALSGAAYVREYTVPFEVLAYPPGVDGDPVASRWAAVAAYQTILRALDSGHGVGPDRGYALRVPFYDYSAVAAGLALPPGSEPFDYLVIQGLDGAVRQDPEQDDLYTVAIDFRANWRDDGDTRRFTEGVELQGIPMGWRPPAP